ncbi:MAG: aspartate-semialdehyde dehydrogenase, partial [Verrucomicrobia bacterium]|nr:aspartate-semialdehyde dehydrogenase [Verrucomicrobiota bacterium]
MSKKLNVAIVGASGAVGLEMIRTLEKRQFPVKNLSLLASAKSAGRSLPFRGQPIVIEELRENSFAGIDLALFSAGASISKHFAPLAVQA